MLSDLAANVTEISVWTLLGPALAGEGSFSLRV